MCLGEETASLSSAFYLFSYFSFVPSCFLPFLELNVSFYFAPPIETSFKTWNSFFFLPHLYLLPFKAECDLGTTFLYTSLAELLLKELYNTLGKYMVLSSEQYFSLQNKPYGEFHQVVSA
jgi:hypothetical protein